jgi:MFS family permease
MTRLPLRASSMSFRAVQRNNMPKKKVFYGWYVVIGCVLLRLGLGIPNYSLSVFLIPMCDTLGISRGAFSAYSTFSHLMTMLMLPFLGQWFKKYSFKRLLWLGAIMTTIAMFCYSLVKQAWHFYAFSALYGIFTGMLNSVPIAMLTAAWFKKKRALATSIAFAGSGISAMMVVPLANRIIEAASWMAAFRVIAVIYMIFVFVPLIFIIKVKPSDMGLKAYGEEEVQEPGSLNKSEEAWGVTRNQALRTSTFWLIGGSMFLTGFVFMGTMNHIIPYLTDLGYTSAFASLSYSVIMLFDTVGKISLGIVYEKAGFRKTNLGIYGLFFISELVLMLAVSKPLVIAYAVIMGLCAGIQTGVYPVVINRLLGDKEYGVIYSNLTVLYFVGMSIGIPASGIIYDALGSYMPAWIAYSAIIALIAMLLVLAEKRSAKEISAKI